MSDVQAATQSGAATVESGSESHFDSLWDQGAFEPPKPIQDDAAGAQAAAGDDRSNETQIGDEAVAETKEGAEEAVETKPTWETVDDFLKAHEVDPAAFQGLKVTVKIDGQEKPVPIADVIKSFQLEGHVNNKSIALSNQQTAFEQERQAARTLMQQQLQQNKALGDAAMQMLNQDFARVDWQRLRVENPGEFAALSNEYHSRQAAIQNHLQYIEQQRQVETQQLQEAKQTRLAHEREQMLNQHPEWRDNNTFQKDRAAMFDYARQVGLKDAEISVIGDHRFMSMLHDAARFRALQAATPQAVKQVREAPKVVKPGTRNEGNPAESRRKEVIERFNRNPRDIDSQAAVFELFSN